MAPFDRLRTSFLFVFHCNYGRIMCHFRYKARYWSKNANFSYPLPFNLHDHQRLGQIKPGQCSFFHSSKALFVEFL